VIAARYRALVDATARATERGVDPNAAAAEPAPWEGRLEATCECLSWRGSLDHLERRNAEDRLGESIYSELPPPATSALVVAHSLIERGVLTESQLAEKMSEVRARLERA
jgi:hypothetical protein